MWLFQKVEGAKEVSRPRVSAEIESKEVSRRSEREREREDRESLLGSRNLASTSTACISYLYMHVVHFINVVQFLLLSKHEIHSSYDV